MMRDLLKTEDVVILVTSQSLFRNASNYAQEVRIVNSGAPKEMAQKIKDLTQTLEATEESLHKLKAENKSLKEENENLRNELIRRKAQLLDFIEPYWM